MGKKGVESMIEEIKVYIENCKPMPLSQTKISVQKPELLSMLDELELKLPGEIVLLRNGLHPGIMGIPEQTYTTVPVYSRGSESSHPCSRTYLQMSEQEVMQHHSRMHVLSGYCMCTQNSTDHMQ